MSVTIHIANLPIDAAEETLRGLFSSYGAVQSVRVVRSSLALGKTSYGFVEMPDGSAVAKAIRDLNGRYLRGSLLAVETIGGREQSPLRRLRS